MKKSKKVILSLAATLILSTSVGHAQGIKYTIRTNSNNGNYIIRFSNFSNKYLNTRYPNILFQCKPVWNWDNIEDTNNDENTNPGSEKPNTPEEPKEETEKPETPEEPKGQEKPEEPKKPETPKAPEKPQNPKPQEPKEEPTTPTKPGNNAVNSIEEEVARLVNIERQKAGLAPLTLSTELSNVARIKSKDMADKNYFSHTSPTYGDPFQMMRSFGIKYGYAGENIAKGYRSAQAVMDGWMNSSGHRANILNPNFKTIGVGYVESNGTTYWTQMFTD